MDALIGYTGFVGGNLHRQHAFDALFNSKNIEEIRGRSFARIVHASSSRHDGAFVGCHSRYLPRAGRPLVRPNPTGAGHLCLTRTGFA